MIRSGSIKDEISILKDLMAFLRDNVRIAEDKSRNAVDKRRYIASSTYLSQVHKGTRKPNTTKGIVLRVGRSKMHGGGIEEDKDSVVWSSGRDQADTVSGGNMGRSTAKEKLIREGESFGNRMNKEESGSDFGSNLKDYSFLRSKSRQEQSSMMPLFSNDIDSS